MTVVGQPQVVYTYDNANRLTNIQQGTSNIVIGYDDADRRTSVTYPNTNSITYAYNAASELISLTYKKGATTLGDLTYTYDAAGNRIKTGGTFARSNVPPALATANYNANNQQLTFGTTTETYDLNGNLATTTDAGVVTTYTWNARNQLTGISRTGLTASFTYDSFGRRTGKTINGTTTNFVYDGLNPVQEKNGATVTANLLTGLGIDEFFTRTEGVVVRSLLPDALGSTVALGDGTGTLQTQYTYEPFGFVSQTGSASTSSYKYTAREDDGTGLLYYRARYYHPRMQRFISEDPIEFDGGDVNIYAYVSNNATNLTDPSGEGPRMPKPPKPKDPGSNDKGASGQKPSANPKPTCILLPKPFSGGPGSFMNPCDRCSRCSYICTGFVGGPPVITRFQIGGCATLNGPGYVPGFIQPGACDTAAKAGTTANPLQGLGPGDEP
jgi:RHS repeat-associated protein